MNIHDDGVTLLMIDLFYDFVKNDEPLSSAKIRELTGARTEQAPIVLMVQAFYAGFRTGCKFAENEPEELDDNEAGSHSV